MTDCTTRQFTMTIGVDLGDRYSYFAVLDEAGELVEEGPSAVPGRFSTSTSPDVPDHVSQSKLAHILLARDPIPG